MNKWAGLDNEKFEFVDLGRSAMFLLPLNKLAIVEEDLHKFLIEKIGTFTAFSVETFGVWINTQRILVWDKCRLYDVSFSGKERITILGEKLAEIAVTINEECIFFKAGQYGSLIYPRRNQ